MDDQAARTTVCTHCGASVTGGRFCTNCGARIEAVPAVSEDWPSPTDTAERRYDLVEQPPPPQHAPQPPPPPPPTPPRRPPPRGRPPPPPPPPPLRGCRPRLPPTPRRTTDRV